MLDERFASVPVTIDAGNVEQGEVRAFTPVGSFDDALNKSATEDDGTSVTGSARQTSSLAADCSGSLDAPATLTLGATRKANGAADQGGVNEDRFSGVDPGGFFIDGVAGPPTFEKTDDLAPGFYTLATDSHAIADDGPADAFSVPDGPAVPLPAAVWSASVLLGAIFVLRLSRRRRTSSLPR